MESVFSKCTPCAIGTYKNNDIIGEGCQDCPTTFITEIIGAKSVSDCYIQVCPLGQESIRNICSVCKIGFYKDNELPEHRCTPCPPSFTTLTTESIAISDCNIKKCDLGMENILNVCIPCPIGKYKDNAFVDVECIDCPKTFTTTSTGSISLSNCNIQICQPGYQSIFKICVPCEIGYYKSNNYPNEQCIPCPYNYLTFDIHSTSFSDCNILICDEGLEESDGRCQQCNLGFYKDNKGIGEMCIPCPNNYTTKSTGSVSESDCSLLICNKGEEDILGICTPCEIGYYKDVVIYQYRCLLCPPSYTTEFIGSTDKSNCSIRSCPRGYYYKNKNCVSCPIGTFKNNDNFDTECEICPDSYTTKHTSSENIDDCNQHYCELGLYSVNEICEYCPIATYKNTKIANIGCRPCPKDFTTEGAGSTSLYDCKIRICNSGYQSNNGECEPCSVGFYKDTYSSTNCIQCYDDRLTLYPASTSIADCIIENCDGGYYFDLKTKTCIECGIGYYRDKISTSLKCNKCKEGYITLLEISLSEFDCNIVMCEPGSMRIDEDTCKKCKIGYYQPKKWQTNCIECPFPLTTINQGSTDEDDCIFNCPSGFEQKFEKLECKSCNIGYYRNNNHNLKCLKCPDGYTTMYKESTSLDDCSVPNCGSGEYIQNNKCVKCPIGSFSDTIGQQFLCTPCPRNFTTEFPGSTSQLDCFISQCKNKKHNCGPYHLGNICIDIEGGFMCQCRKGWKKINSQCIHLCDANYCENGGICDRSNIEMPICHCPENYGGPKCSDYNDNSWYKNIIIGAIVIAVGFTVVGGIILLVKYILPQFGKNITPKIEYINPEFASNPYPATNKIGSNSGPFQQRNNPQFQFYDEL
ncbi:hypothetical protein A3Q56_02275 [Intoshia linei]|uniref:EGF-like domain-containing protein n=1 Tax=Intoshia linei TaxID=1819745 RepID=A0A177B8B3_9BILA|nr:hypothetical protein A3Q56_02275 [Intoshia linei]